MLQRFWWRDDVVSPTFDSVLFCVTFCCWCFLPFFDTRRRIMLPLLLSLSHMLVKQQHKSNIAHATFGEMNRIKIIAQFTFLTQLDWNVWYLETDLARFCQFFVKWNMNNNCCWKTYYNSKEAIFVHNLTTLNINVRQDFSFLTF